MKSTEIGWAILQNDLLPIFNDRSYVLDLSGSISTAQAYVDQQKWQKALSIYQQLVTGYPDLPDLHHLQALVLFELADYSEALKSIEKAIAIGPVKAGYLQNQADALSALGRYDEAISAYKEALQIEPNDIDVLINMGNAYHLTGDTDSALKCYKKILVFAPDAYKAINNIGKIYFGQGDIKTALTYYDNALQLDADYAEAKFNKAVALLSIGEYEKGWSYYESRFERKDAHKVYPHKLRGTHWNGLPFRGESLLIHCEQGQGDVIQFFRYLPMVKALGGKIILEVQDSLAPLLENSPSVDDIIVFDAKQKPAVHYDQYIAIGSLPMLMKTTLDTIPAHPPYIEADGGKTARWRKRIASAAFHVGIVWAGSDVDPQRACRLSDWHSWWSNPHIQFYSLQKGVGAIQLSELPDGTRIEHLGDELIDFSDTAAVIANLDLIISVDTAVAHLAGAMGKPVWVLLPKLSDWRWFWERTDSPWYPTARLFRQGRYNNWTDVVIEVKNALDALMAGHDTVVSTRKSVPTSSGNGNRFNQSQTQYNSGLQYLEAGEYRHAVELFLQAITVRPEWADAYFELGRAYHGQGLLKQAIEAYRTATRLSPDMQPAHSNLGLAYYQTGELDQAVSSYEQAINLNHDLAVVFNNLGVIREEQGKLEAAVNCYQSALCISPDYADALFNMGNTHLSRRNLDQALSCFKQAVQFDPMHAKTHGNLGRTYHLMGLVNQANECFEKALRLKPDYPEAHFNRAVCKLLAGRWEEGWQEYEWRFKCKNRHRAYPHRLNGERWYGESFAGRTLLVHSEQGIGDALQFVRYLPMVKERGGRIIFEARRSLMNLFKNLQELDELIELSADRPPSPHYDLYVPLCSLAGIFNTIPSDVPNRVPYLKADPAKVNQWRKRLPDSGINVGLVWSGNDTYKERTVTLTDLIPLAFIKGINWIGLQKGPAASQVRADCLPHNFKVNNWGEIFEDFSDTAAAVECLDLIISIDTAVAHLAGAMGKQVWILLPAVPDWRWLLDQSRTPWYPTAQLFRQFGQGDWDAIITHMSVALEQWVKIKVPPM